MEMIAADGSTIANRTASSEGLGNRVGRAPSLQELTIDPKKQKKREAFAEKFVNAYKNFGKNEKHLIS